MRIESVDGRAAAAGAVTDVTVRSATGTLAGVLAGASAGITDGFSSAVRAVFVRGLRTGAAVSAADFTRGFADAARFGVAAGAVSVGADVMSFGAGAFLPFGRPSGETGVSPAAFGDVVRVRDFLVSFVTGGFSSGIQQCSEIQTVNKRSV
ncbi:MAG TPA: hypothetical protein VFJ02_23795 [Vicinamibacterales bacterium]|nr:hypothetical protein [Vicinamibacterales bacterium]